MLHEIQHADLNQKGLITSGQLPSLQSDHSLMSSESSEYYKERHDSFKENRNMWLQFFQKLQKDKIYKTEDEFIKGTINEGTL